MRGKTADFVEEQKAVDSPENRRSSGELKQLRNGADPSVGKATQFKPGQSGNPGGRPKNDAAKEIAQAIFENHPDEIYKAFRKALLKSTPDDSLHTCRWPPDRPGAARSGVGRE